MSSNTASPFSDRAANSGYATRTRRLVPGYDDMLRMAGLLAAERAPADGSILVIGAGGGEEIATFARLQPQWRFVGVDPAQPMLDLAREKIGPQGMERVQLHQGYADTAPAGPFDAATCILTLHFVAPDERQRTLAEIRRRLKPGAPFVIAHLSFPQAAEDKALWFSRYVAFATSSGVEIGDARNAAKVMTEQLTLLSPADEEAMLREAGFTGSQTFYQGFTFRGWVAFA